MNLKKLIQPTVLLTFAFLLYTGCKRAAPKYIYLHPLAMATNTKGHIPELTIVADSGLYIEVRLQTQVVQVAGLMSLPGNAAYATSIREPIPIALEKINNIRIRPLHDYNATYPAFSDMTVASTFVTATVKAYADTLSKEELIDNMDRNEDRYASDFQQRPFYIKLNEPPSGTGEQRFIIELITEKNGRLADTTQPIILTP